MSIKIKPWGLEIYRGKVQIGAAVGASEALRFVEEHLTRDQVLLALFQS